MRSDIMIVILCFLSPAVLLMVIRNRILESRILQFKEKSLVSLICEYCLANLFLNLTAILITCVVFRHTGPVEEAMQQYTDFALHYLMLSIAIAIIEPLVENMVRFHLSFNIKKLEISIQKDWLLYGYAFILFVLNFIRIFDNTFWGDEGFTIRLAKMSVKQMTETTAGDVHPPLYYLFARLLYRIFGNFGWVYHLSALIPYTIIIILACTIIKKQFNTITAIVLITMSSIMKGAVIYNVEVRMYALAAMFVFIAYIELYKIINRNKIIDWIIFCIASLGAAYTHYYALISVAFLYLMLLFMIRKNKRNLKEL